MGRSRAQRGFAAAPPQRRKVAGEPCAFCGQGPCDPAHVIDRSLGGCDNEACVVPLCREHHRQYDEGHLDLLPALEPKYRAELAHAVQHIGLARTYWRVTNERAA